MTRFDLDDISLGDVEDDGSYPGGRTSTAPADGVDVPRGTRVDAKPRFDDELVGLFQRRGRRLGRTRETLDLRGRECATCRFANAGCAASCS